MLIIKQLGIQDYQKSWDKMLDFTNRRKPDTPDELWLLEHKPVFTQGRAGKKEHIIQKTDIPIVQSDRGGQITYHGPGQLVIYFLLDLKRLGLGIKSLVNLLEQSVIELLAGLNIKAETKTGAPGVYVKNSKIAALGLRVRNSCTLHGLSLNVDMDLKPFSYINPCGYKDLAVTQIKDIIGNVDFSSIRQDLVAIIGRNLGYKKLKYVSET